MRTHKPCTLKGLAAIGRSSPAGALTLFPLPTPNGIADDITVGPDGNLWFTDNGRGHIGRITTAGVVTEFPLARTTVARPTGITAGPDGDVWFLEVGAFGNAPHSHQANGTLLGVAWDMRRRGKEVLP